MRFFETLEKQPCKRRSDIVLNGQMSTKINGVILKTELLENRVSGGLPVQQIPRTTH